MNRLVLILIFSMGDLISVTACPGDSAWWQYLKPLPLSARLDPGKMDFARTLKADEIALFKKTTAYHFEIFNERHKDPKALENYLDGADINNDGRTDILFCGPWDNDGEVVRIFLNMKDSFSLVFEGFQYIVDIKFKDHLLNEITLADPGCCADPHYTEKTFSVYFTKEKDPAKSRPDFFPVKNRIFLFRTEGPDEYFSKPLNVSTVNKTTLFRYSAGVIDGPFDSFLEVNGNITGYYKSGCEGIAIGKKTDSSGNEWWLVEMNDLCKPQKTCFYIPTDIPGHYVGWILKKDLEVITE